jgi:hypothetical protein
MPRKPVDFDTVREIAMALVDVEESMGRGVSSFKVRGKLLVWPAMNRSAEPGSLAVRIDANVRAGLLASAPDVYYVTPHYESHPVVLVRLARISRAALTQLLGTAWLFASSTAAKRRAKAETKKRARRRR